MAGSLKSQDLVVGIIASATETRKLLRERLQTACAPSALVEGDQYSLERADRVARRFEEARPQIIVVDMENPQEALLTMRILHEALPEAWLFASSEATDPQLIIETMRAGAREFLPKPLTPESLSEAIARYTAQRPKEGGRKLQGKIYCVMAAKGGAGTTSVAVNLAVSLAAGRNVKVALIDLGSPVGDAAEYLNLKSSFSVADALASAPRLDPVLLESFMSRAHGVAVLPGIKEFQSGGLRPEALEKMLHVAAQTYSHVFLDTFCCYDEEQLRALTEFSAAVILVLTAELPALWRTDGLIRVLEKIGAEDKLRLVVNRAGKRHVIAAKEIEKTLKHSIYWNLPNNYPAAIQAVNSGKPLVMVNHSTLAASYSELAQALTGVSLRKRPRGIFGLFS